MSFLNSKTGLRKIFISAARFFSHTVLDFVYPPYCVLCDGELAEHDILVCHTCLDTLPRLDEPVAPAQKLAHQLSEPAWFEASMALFPYQESVKKLIHLLKYKGYKSLALPLGVELGQLLRETLLPADVLLVPVPLHKRRLRERGYNQSELLAIHAAAKSGFSLKTDLLQRTRYTQPQAKLSKKARSRNLAGAFEVTKPDLLQQATVVLVDDLFTTGHTLNECAKTLMAGGARQVFCLTLIRV